MLCLNCLKTRNLLKISEAGTNEATGTGRGAVMPGRTPSLRQQLRILRFTGDHGSMLHRDLRVKEKQAAASAKIAIEKSFIPPSLPSSPLSTAAVPDTPLSPLPESRPLRSGSFICHAGPVTGLPKNGWADRFPVPLRAHVCGPHRYRRNMAAPSTIRPPAARQSPEPTLSSRPPSSSITLLGLRSPAQL